MGRDDSILSEYFIYHNLYIIVLVTHVTVKGQATQKKPWWNHTHNFANGEVKKGREELENFEYITTIIETHWIQSCNCKVEYRG